MVFGHDEFFERYPYLGLTLKQPHLQPLTGSPGNSPKLASLLLLTCLMGRCLRHMKDPNTTFEITIRAIQGRLLLRPWDWPGVNCIEAVTRGKKLSGVWYDRTKEYEARKAGEAYRHDEFAKKYDVPLSPLPCLEGLSQEEQRAWYRTLVASIEQETRKHYTRGGKRVLGVRGVLRQGPHSRPKKVKRSPAPLCHCSDPDKWRAYRDNYRWFVDQYRVASKRLRAGELNVRFPENCFPPPLAFPKNLLN